MDRPFFYRHKEAILNKELPLSLSPKRLRRRLWKILQSYDDRIRQTPRGFWLSVDDLAIRELKKVHGFDQLTAFNEDNEEVEVDNTKAFVLGTYPAQVFDLIELYYNFIPDDESKLNFQNEVNATLREEDCPWAMTNGKFLKVDAEFIDQEIRKPAYRLLESEQFIGALEEFKKSKAELDSGRSEQAIVNAGKAYESVLQSILGKNTGVASTLIRQYREEGFLDKLPEGKQKVFSKKIMQVLPVLRNELGAHGQGENVIDVPENFARLAVNLSAALILFLVQEYQQEEQSDREEKRASESEDEEIPF